MVIMILMSSKISVWSEWELSKKEFGNDFGTEQYCGNYDSIEQ